MDGDDRWGGDDAAATSSAAADDGIRYIGERNDMTAVATTTTTPRVESKNKINVDVYFCYR